MKTPTFSRDAGIPQKRRLEAYRKKLGKILRKWRTESEMSREDVVLALRQDGFNVSVATVLRWENGRADIRMIHVEFLERVKPGLVAMICDHS